jgi:murein DD-endopeptidase MepM/ murein hydrolase activator NlpD
MTAQRQWMWISAAIFAALLLVPARPRTARAVAPQRNAASAQANGSEQRPAGPEDHPQCAEGSLPDGNVCVEIPEHGEGGPALPAAPGSHHDRHGRLSVYEQIPKLPERPADYDAYRYPVPPGLPGGHFVVSGYDLDKPDEHQRRGRRLSHVGHGGADIPGKIGTPVQLVALEHQQGEARVLYAGTLFGTTVLTHHVVREEGRLRDYLVLFGHLDSVGKGVIPGTLLRDGDIVGALGDTSSPGMPHLHLEIRRFREGVDPARVAAGGQLIAETISVVCDPRNVLPLK